MVLKRFWQNRDGGVAPVLALAALPLFGAVGAAVDYSRAASARTDMQNALDATALLLAKSGATDIGAQATSYFNANFSSPSVQNLAVTAASSSSGSTTTVSLSATGSVQSQFVGMLGVSNMNVAVRSSAAMTSDQYGCVLSLSQTAAGAITGQGTSSVNLSGCSLYDNSSSATALTMGGSARLTALSVGVVGGVSGRENIAAMDGIRTGTGVVKDPYADASFATPGACTDKNFTAKTTITIDPGVYCGGIGVNAGAVLTLNPGVYYLDGTGLTVNGGATITGAGVTLVFTAKNRTDWPSATINGNAVVNLTPPKSGPTAGIVLFGDRRIPTGTSFKLNGSSSQYFAGAIYLPTAAVQFSGGTGTSSSCTQIIGDTVTFTGNSSVAINCSSYNTKPFGSMNLKISS